jgi:hypothetical protein
MRSCGAWSGVIDVVAQCLAGMVDVLARRLTGVVDEDDVVEIIARPEDELMKMDPRRVSPVRAECTLSGPRQVSPRAHDGCAMANTVDLIE